MKDPRWTGDGKRRLHILVGIPDDDCPVCRAHGFAGDEEEEPLETLDEAELRALEELLACRCPVCRPTPRRRSRDEA